eukprot:TRINITY_DN11783_c0_g1_i2.p1 TRINITY_DN11783_c0_g1~~TRINITY_DN11783_c0_g1_i2.p1  ORF type:complete len:280 (-),score=44.83 TRINITY_DN11783_c0_g1_i2:379-1218(-)
MAESSARSSGSSSARQHPGVRKLRFDISYGSTSMASQAPEFEGPALHDVLQPLRTAREAFYGYGHDVRDNASNRSASYQSGSAKSSSRSDNKSYKSWSASQRSGRSGAEGSRRKGGGGSGGSRVSTPLALLRELQELQHGASDAGDSCVPAPWGAERANEDCPPHEQLVEKRRRYHELLDEQAARDRKKKLDRAAQAAARDRELSTSLHTKTHTWGARGCDPHVEKQIFEEVYNKHLSVQSFACRPAHELLHWKCMNQSEEQVCIARATVFRVPRIGLS